MDRPNQQDWADMAIEEQWLADAATRSHAVAAPHDKDPHMKIGDMIESKYLKQSDVDDETVVTIHGLKKVNVARDDEDPEYRWTVKFTEFAKPMVLNVTNLKRLAKALGDDTEDWLGKQVIVYVDPDIEFGGNIVGGLRIKAHRAIWRSRNNGSRVRNEDDINAALDDAAPPF